jgi:hypothetical protein
MGPETKRDYAVEGQQQFAGPGRETGGMGRGKYRSLYNKLIDTNSTDITLFVLACLF